MHGKNVGGSFLEFPLAGLSIRVYVRVYSYVVQRMGSAALNGKAWGIRKKDGRTEATSIIRRSQSH